MLPFRQLHAARSKLKPVVNSYCFRKTLIRKSNFAFALQQYVAKNPASDISRHVPATHRLELDHPDYFDEMMDDCFEVRDALQANDGQRFIMKASVLSKGDQIYLIDSLAQLESIVTRMYEDDEDGDIVREWIMQLYIDKPLLEFNQSRKFHLRVYVLVIGRMQVFVYGDYLALFASQKYHDASLQDKQAHLTNTCLQRTND